MQDTIPFHSSIPVILVLSTATMAYIHYHFDRLSKVNDKITEKLECIGEEGDSRKSIMEQSPKTKTLYDNTLEAIPPHVIKWYTTGFLFLVFFMAAISEIILIGTQIFFPEYIFSNIPVGSVSLIELALIIASMSCAIWRLKKLNNFVQKRDEGYEKICDQIGIITDINDALNKDTIIKVTKEYETA